MIPTSNEFIKLLKKSKFEMGLQNIRSGAQAFAHYIIYYIKQTKKAHLFDSKWNGHCIFNLIGNLRILEI